MTIEEYSNEAPNTMAASVRVDDGGLFGLDTIIERDTPLPVKKSQVFSVWERGLELRVYQGEHRYAEQNMLLGTVRIDGIQYGPAEVEVTFAVDVNGIFNITVHNKTMRKKTRTTIATSLALPKGDAQLEALFARSFNPAQLERLFL